MSLANGTQFGPYEIVSSLGAGGMGEVYRARDTRLGRHVAIKVLPAHLSANADSKARFEREAKAVAALSHPNILAIYDVGHQNDTAYVVTELLEGETLRQALLNGAIARRRALEIGIAVSDGLAAAHARGVVHRDLKPENIFLTTDGVVKILDFGLAQVKSAGSPGQEAAQTPTVTLNTSPGTILGTINYMSPEQIRAQRTDARSDVFSLGCVLYEMLTGEKAFQGQTSADTMTAILREAPISVRSKRQDVGPELERVIERCLEKKPETRFQSSQDLSFTLRSILADSGSRTPRETRKPVQRLGLIVSLIGALIVAGGFFIVRYGLNKARFVARQTIDSLAVLPLENVSRDPEQEYFVDGMTEALISDLAKIGGLKVISRTSAMRYKVTTKSLPEIAKELKVDAVVEGSVLRIGDRVRITTQLIYAATDEHLWSESYDRDLSDILRLQSEVARTIAQEIKVKLTPQEQARMVAARPVNPEAYQAYLKGRFHWNKRTPDGVKKAVEYFEQAVALAPDWPLGYLGLADTYVVIPQYGSMRPREAMPKARSAATKALELDASLGEAHATLGLIAEDYDWDWPTTEREFKRALELNPNYATVHHWYALYFLHMGRPEEAVREMKKAQELDPLSLIIGSVLGMAQWSAGRLDESESSLRRTLELGPEYAMAHMNLAITLFLQGRQTDAISEAREAVRLSNNALNHASLLAFMCAKTGESEEARRILADLTARSTESYVAPTYFARVYAGLGDTDQMFYWLEKAYQERDAWLLNVLIEPFLAPMRADPRFADLVRRVGLPPLKATPFKGSSSTPAAGKIMLAVLPFENLSRDPEQDYFSDGLTEEMISQLSRLNPRKLGVIARTSAMHYKNTAQTIDAIGRELGVAYIVEGSVRRAGERVRITAQLIAVSDQTHLWAENYERDLKDIFALQSDVAERIAGSLTVELLPGVASTPAQTRTINPTAHEAYLKGRFHWNKRTPEGLKKAVDYFEQAVALAPDWPLGFAGLADTYALMPNYSSVRTSEAMPKARAAAAKALEMDESLGEAHATMALIATMYDWNWSTAEREYKRALALSPNYATAHHWYALHLTITGQDEEAIKEIIKARELDPLSLIISSVTGALHYYARDFVRADTPLRKTLELGPDFAYAHGMLAKSLLLQGRLTEANTEAREAVRLSNHDSYYGAILGYVCARGGQPEEARRILDELTTRSTVDYVAPTHFALVYTGLGEGDKMFDWLERAYQERDVNLLYALIDPFLAPMRGDPRFADLVRRVGLPP